MEEFIDDMHLTYDTHPNILIIDERDKGEILEMLHKNLWKKHRVGASNEVLIEIRSLGLWNFGDH